MLDLGAIGTALARIATYPWAHKADSNGYVSVKDADGWEVCEVNMTRETGPVNGAAIAGMPGTIAALVAEVERLRIAVDMYRRITGDNEAEIGRLRRAIEAHRTSILNGGHPLHEDVTLWEVLDA